MISHKYKCIFIEVPKTGSSSIRNILGFPPRAHLDIWHVRYNMENYWTHYGGPINKILSSAYMLLPDKLKVKIGDRQFKSYYKFGFVRNPWDRVVSLYFRKEGLQMRNQMTFEEFCSWIKYSSSTCIYPGPHLNQLDWFVDPNGIVLVDFIGKFENLQNDWEIIRKKLGLTQSLPHSNKNPFKDKPYTDYYTETSRQIIAQKFKVDIEYFGYEFGK